MVFYLFYRIMFYHGISKYITNQSTENTMTQHDKGKFSSVWAQDLYPVHHVSVRI